jgi:hypothetical protein
MCKAPVLIHVNPDKPFVLETDCSNYALAGVLSQAVYDDAMAQHVLKPVGYHSRTLNEPERNYEIYDKELLAIVVMNMTFTRTDRRRSQLSIEPTRSQIGCVDQELSQLQGYTEICIRRNDQVLSAQIVMEVPNCTTMRAGLLITQPPQLSMWMKRDSKMRATFEFSALFMQF